MHVACSLRLAFADPLWPTIPFRLQDRRSEQGTFESNRKADRQVAACAERTVAKMVKAGRV